MAEVNQRTYPLTLNILGNPVPGRVLINTTNGDMEWFYSGDPYPTLRSTKGSNYKWSPDSSDSYYNLKESINDQFTKLYTEDEVKREVNIKSIPELNKQRRIFYERNAPETGKSLGLIKEIERAPGSPTANPENPGEITDEKPGDAPGLTDLSENFRDKNEFNNIKKFLYYPNTILSNGQDKLLISQYSYVPAPITSGRVESVQSNLTNRNTQFTEWLGTVTLPIPNDLSEMNQVGWGEDNLSGITASLMGAGTGIVKDLSGFDAQGLIRQFGNLGGILGSTAVQTRLKQFLTASTSAEILKKIGINVNPEAYINRVTGAAINTNLELLFNGPKLRPFSLTFKMSPRNKDEAQNIRSIIKFLKKGMSPKRSKNSDVMYFLGSPNVFKIKFTKGESTLDDPLNIKDLDSIGRFKTCALVSCGVNYTPDGVYASFNDPIVGSQPISVLVTLSFIELTPIFNDEYEDSSTIGPERINEKFEYQESTN